MDEIVKKIGPWIVNEEKYKDILANKIKTFVSVPALPSHP